MQSCRRLRQYDFRGLPYSFDSVAKDNAVIIIFNFTRKRTRQTSKLKEKNDKKQRSSSVVKQELSR